MKRHLLVVPLGLVLTALIGTAQAQTFTLNGSTISGGGGTSTGGVFTVRGTIGQPVAGKMSGGAYMLSGGFWSLVSVVQTPGAPLLSITRTSASTIAVSWPSPSPGYVLQQNPDLWPNNWLEVGATPSDNGTTKTVIMSLPVGRMFYRLVKH